MNAELTALASVSAPIAPLQSAAVMKRIMKVVSSRFAAGTDRGRSSGDTPNGVISWAQGFANKSKLSTTAKNARIFRKIGRACHGLEKQLDESKIGFEYAFSNGDIDAFARDIDTVTHTLFTANANPTAFSPT